MGPFHFLLIFTLLNLAFAGNHATLTKEEVHWKSVFPNTPLPKVLQDILPRPGRSTIFRDKVDPESEGVNDPEFGAYWYDGSYGDNSGKESKEGESPTNKGVNDINFLDFSDYEFTYDYESGEKESSGHHRAAPSNEGVNDADFADYTYMYAKKSRDDDAPNDEGLNKPESGNKHSSGKQSDYGNVAAIKETIYFFQETLVPGKKVNLPRLTQRIDTALFLPQQIAESMPMSSDKLPDILKNFSLKAESSYAGNVRVTVMNCERAEMRGEEKYCATSLESFVDLAVAMLGKNIRLLSHQLGKGLKNPLFTIDRGMRDMGDNNIVCHKMKYPYAVYLCHSIKKTTVYQVPLVSMDGTKSNAVAVCHKDTSAWSPNHIAFQFLKVKPGSVPICHFLGRDTVVWVPN